MVILLLNLWTNLDHDCYSSILRSRYYRCNLQKWLWILFHKMLWLTSMSLPAKLFNEIRFKTTFVDYICTSTYTAQYFKLVNFQIQKSCLETHFGFTIVFSKFNFYDSLQKNWHTCMKKFLDAWIQDMYKHEYLNSLMVMMMKLMKKVSE